MPPVADAGGSLPQRMRFGLAVIEARIDVNE
jgi:hypothetical protein